MSSTLYAAATTLAAPPAVVTDQLNYVLDILAWLVTAAGVCGLLIVGSRMAVSLRVRGGRRASQPVRHGHGRLRHRRDGGADRGVRAVGGARTRAWRT